MNARADEALKVAKTFIDGLTRKDTATLLGLLDDNVVLEAPYPLVAGENVTGAKRCTGEAVRSYLRDIAVRVGEIRFDNAIWRTTNDGLAILEADGDLKYPDGRPYRNHYLMMFEVANGKLIRWREYYSPVVWARAYGAPLESLPT